MKRLIPALLIAALLFTACTAPPETPSADDYEVYYAAIPGWGDGSNAIRASSVRVEDSASMDAAALAIRLVSALLEPPEDIGLRSPFPTGTSLQKLLVAGGRAAVDLSEPYAHLSGVDLSVADYCMTLTLTQIDGINAVRITANGRELPYRRTQLMTAADALLSGVEDAPRPINVSLYFLDVETGELRAQQQSLALYEGQSRVSAVLDALTRGPEGDETLRTLLPPGFSVLSSRTEDGVCYVNVSPDVALPEDEALRALAAESLAKSILSLSGVEEVQFLIDGTAAPELSLPASAQTAPAET